MTLCFGTKRKRNTDSKHSNTNPSLSHFCDVPFLYALDFIDRYEKTIRYESRKVRADIRKRVKGRFVKAGEAFDYDPLAVTKSY